MTIAAGALAALAITLAARRADALAPQEFFVMNNAAAVLTAEGLGRRYREGPPEP